MQQMPETDSQIWKTSSRIKKPWKKNHCFQWQAVSRNQHVYQRGNYDVTYIHDRCNIQMHIMQWIDIITGVVRRLHTSSRNIIEIVSLLRKVGEVWPWGKHRARYCHLLLAPPFRLTPNEAKGGSPYKRVSMALKLLKCFD